MIGFSIVWSTRKLPDYSPYAHTHTHALVDVMFTRPFEQFDNSAHISSDKLIPCGRQCLAGLFYMLETNIYVYAFLLSSLFLIRRHSLINLIEMA